MEPPDPEAHNVDHFKCYKVRRAPGEPKYNVEGIHVNNQLGPVLLETKRPKELCVPSEKAPLLHVD